MHWARILLIALPLVFGHQAWALDPTIVDILRLRLGMTAPAVLAHLAEQGIVDRHVQRKDGICTAEPRRRCSASIVATTKDGILTIDFAEATDTAATIQYQFTGRGVGEPAMIRESTLNRFGPPDAPASTSWCARTAAGACPKDRAYLSLRPGPGVSSVLVLDGGSRGEPASR